MTSGLPKPERSPSSHGVLERSCGIDCQTRSGSCPRSSSCCQRRSAPSQPSLSWTAVTPREFASLHAGAHRLEVLVVGHDHVALLEAPRRLFAQDAGRLAVLVALDDAAVHLEVAVRARECGRVQPERVVVLGDHRGRRVAGDRVEIVPCRLALRLPVAAPPAVAAQPAPGGRARRRADAVERLVERRAAVELHLVLRERPGREVHVRVGESRHTTRPPRSTTSGEASAVSCTPTPPATSRPRSRAPAASAPAGRASG